MTMTFYVIDSNGGKEQVEAANAMAGNVARRLREKLHA